MQPSAPRPLSIDLSGKNRETFDSVFYRWAINVGKTIIVVVELVALGALMYRFYIDRQLVDQREEIERQAFLVNAQQKEVDELESVSTRISAVEKTQQSTENVFGIVAQIRSALDQSLFESGEIIINRDTITFQARSPSIIDIENFADTLSSDSVVEKISIDELTSSDQGIRFTMTIQLSASEPIL